MKSFFLWLVAPTFFLNTGCNRSASPVAASSTAPTPSAAQANVQISESRAAILLWAALKDQKVADLDCLSFFVESDAGPSKKATEWKFAAREIHNAKCGGDPSTAPVRNRYRIKSNGEVALYDVAHDEYRPLE